MKIILNGKKKELTNTISLTEIVNQYSTNHPRVVAEVNGEIVKNLQWDKTKIKDGDIVELVNLVAGG